MTVQSVLFDVTRWSLNRARNWLLTHGYKTHFQGKHVDKTKHYYRFRQEQPTRYGRYRTLPLPHNEGIKLIVGFPFDR